MGKRDHIGSVIVRKHFQILNTNEKCSDRCTVQMNRIPTWIPDLIFKYPKHNECFVKCILGCIFTWSGSSSYT
jgi:hypothetical protein